MANIAHPGAGRPAARRLTPGQARLLRTGLLRTAVFVAGFLAVVSVLAALG